MERRIACAKCSERAGRSQGDPVTHLENEVCPVPWNESTVDHPPHYGGDTVYEAIKVIEAWALGFCLGNAVKYIARAGKKNVATELEDLRKARWYLDRHITQLEKP